MGNISIKINMEALKCVKQIKKGKSGDVLCLVIPIKANNLYEGEKGTYLDITALELKKPKEGSKDTHLLKQKLSKDVYAAMTEEQKNAMPILGNAIVWGSSTSNEVHTAEVIEEDDDLPF